MSESDPGLEDMPSETGTVDLEDMVVVMEDCQRLPITSLHIRGVGDTTDPRVATSCVCGPDRHGLWLVFNIGEEDRKRAGF